MHKTANIIERIDTSVDPCEDFYSFACGNFIKKVVLPDDKSFVTSISATNDILSLKVRFLVEEELKDSDPPSTKLVKNLYKSCMNIDLIQRKGLEPLKTIIKILGGWPVVEGEDWNESQFDWVELVYKMRKFGYPEVNLLSFGITTDMKNSSWRIIEYIL
ncbi:Neprilysin-21 [Armadillidium vulgare]|nr:Neprilysin-21 [Armadillidium vulgare]